MRSCSTTVLLAVLSLLLTGCPDDDTPVDDDDATASTDDDDSTSDDDDSALDDDDSAAATDDDDSVPVDADGDGVPADEDCDDEDPDNFPGNEEACDGQDNDCDTEVDEGVEPSTWYADLDGDSVGGDFPTVACEVPDGHVATTGDCDDGDPAINPSATEVCNTVDDDCDGLVDEETAAPTTAWADADGDGYGGAFTLDFCLVPTGFVTADGDCDDGDATTFPGATELCDGADNDCDGGLPGDESDADLDGVPSCAGDCDDLEPARFPGNNELCDGQDNDCDALVDEGAIDVVPWHADLDGDGVGGSFTVDACSPPTGFVSTDDDCDDLDPDSFPAAPELCDGVDNDCDGLVPADEADGDADGESICEGDCDDLEPTIWSTAPELCNGLDDNCDSVIDEGLPAPASFWLDADGDGYGDPDIEQVACSAPPSYVDNHLDCDDSDPSDVDSDGDGEPDCSDPDDDDDGLRDDWDAAPMDATVARGPTGGRGLDGSLVLSADLVQDELSFLVGGATTGDVAVTVEDATPFEPGDEVLVLSLQGTDAGAWQAVFVAEVDGDMLTVEPALTDSYDAISEVLVQRIPHYVDLEVPSGVTLGALGWQDGGGGLVIGRAQGTVTVAGQVLAAGAGFAGGDGVVGNLYDPNQGESWSGPGAPGVTTPNQGGGGAYPRRGDNADGGAGGSYGAEGTAGTAYAGEEVTDPGLVYGDPELLAMFAGSGGGGGSPDLEGDGAPSGNVAGAGGSGGGLVALFAGVELQVTATGTVSAAGADGVDALSAGGEVGAGGGGSGGTVRLASPTLTLDGAVDALGGAGGISSSSNVSTPYGSAFGGDGGDGRIRLDVDTLNGSTSPPPGFVATWQE